MKIAIVGSGISGLVTAHLLSGEHEITLFEAEGRIGGHTCTVDAEAGGCSYPVDTGFIVFNEATYPNFLKLMRRLGVAWQPSNMSFSVKCPRTGLEFRPSSLNTLFIQRRNILNPLFYRMIVDIVRFRRDMRRLLSSADVITLTLSEFLDRHGYSRFFKRHFIIPMGAAIWSSDPAGFERFPARFFAQFFHNHGFLDIRQPQWLTLTGGSRQYLDPITRGFRDRIRVNCPVASIRRLPERVEVSAGGAREPFDAVVIASHSDQALALLADPSEAERGILGAIPYQENRTVLHTDSSILPRRKAAWAAWNYLVPERDAGGVALTYDMNILQSIPAPVEFCVSLNLEERLDPAKVLRRMVYHHPAYSPESLAARRRLGEINGVNRTYFAGAYWGYGFHEDGVNSALEVCRHFRKTL
jgi:predicted NAD/FAD-binding protein